MLYLLTFKLGNPHKLVFGPWLSLERLGLSSKSDFSISRFPASPSCESPRLIGGFTTHPHQIRHHPLYPAVIHPWQCKIAPLDDFPIYTVYTSIFMIFFPMYTSKYDIFMGDFQLPCLITGSTVSSPPEIHWDHTCILEKAQINAHLRDFCFLSGFSPRERNCTTVGIFALCAFWSQNYKLILPGNKRKYPGKKRKCPSVKKQMRVF